jgi:threonine/homoserine/homoserine lactone efflux protein
MTTYLILGCVYAFAAAVQPGPLQAYLISQTLTNGWRRTIFASFAPLISDGPIIILVLFILSRFSGGFIQVLQSIGGVFLLYLAYAAFKTWKYYDPEKNVKIQSAKQTVFKATLVNLLNPNPYLGWSLVMGPLLLKSWRDAPLDGIVLLISFYITMIFFTACIVILFSAAKNLGEKVSKILIGISVIALACFGFYQLWLGIISKLWQ